MGVSFRGIRDFGGGGPRGDGKYTAIDLVMAAKGLEFEGAFTYLHDILHGRPNRAARATDPPPHDPVTGEVNVSDEDRITVFETLAAAEKALEAWHQIYVVRTPAGMRYIVAPKDSFKLGGNVIAVFDPMHGRRIFSAADFEGETLPERQWIVENQIPGRNVADLSGDGGIGKSLLALQLLVGVAYVGKWLGMPVGIQGPVIYFCAEDERVEVGRRLKDICASEGIKFSDLGNLHIMPLAEDDATLANFDSKGAMLKAKLWTELERNVKQIQPKLVVR